MITIALVTTTGLRLCRNFDMAALPSYHCHLHMDVGRGSSTVLECCWVTDMWSQPHASAITHYCRGVPSTHVVITLSALPLRQLHTGLGLCRDFDMAALPSYHCHLQTQVVIPLSEWRPDRTRSFSLCLKQSRFVDLLWPVPLLFSYIFQSCSSILYSNRTVTPYDAAKLRFFVTNSLFFSWLS